MSRKNKPKQEAPQAPPQELPVKPAEPEKLVEPEKLLEDSHQPLIKMAASVVMIAIILIVGGAFKSKIFGSAKELSKVLLNDNPPICNGMRFKSVRPPYKGGKAVVVRKNCLNALTYRKKGQKVLVSFSKDTGAIYYAEHKGKLVGPFKSLPHESKDFENFGDLPFRMMGFDGIATIYPQ